jgi:hypothetical protein
MLYAVGIADTAQFSLRIEQHDEQIALCNLALHHETAAGIGYKAGL